MIDSKPINNERFFELLQQISDHFNSFKVVEVLQNLSVDKSTAVRGTTIASVFFFQTTLSSMESKKKLPQKY